MMAWQRAGVSGSLIGGDIVKPTYAQGTGMAGTHLSAVPGGGGAGRASIGRDFADRQRFATTLNGGVGLGGVHGHGGARIGDGGKGTMMGLNRTTAPDRPPR
jgi:hypothetical protein